MNLEGLSHVRSGKVRDIYRCEGGLLLVASDRISAYDVVLPTPVPDKGAVLTGLSAFWFSVLGSASPNHLISCNVDDFPPEAKAHAGALRGRTMYVRDTEVVPIECVARGYLSGSGWKEYRKLGSVCGIGLPEGLVESARLPEPIFTPATKADQGHDENISFERASSLVGAGLMEALRARTLAQYAEASARAEAAGIIIADTKFEFGLAQDGQILLIDEVLTPDSSRFWQAASYEPGRAVPSFDKQYVRDHLDATGWDHTPPGPVLPPEVVTNTRARYVEAYERLTGKDFKEWFR